MTPTPSEARLLERLRDACLSRRLTPAECDEFYEVIRALRQCGEAVAWGATAQPVVGFISVHKSKEDAEQVAAGWATGRVVPLYSLPTLPPQEHPND